MPEIHCRHFNGYKPCGKSTRCERGCPSRSLVGERILIVHLEALGAVLRSTSLLAAVRRNYPSAHITWITKAPAQLLLHNITEIDRVLTLSTEDILQLSALEFDLALVIDKSLVASGLLRSCKVREVRGFASGRNHGEIVPANAAAGELWEIGLSDHKKFFQNKKSEQQLVHESLALGDYRADDYSVQLSAQEISLAKMRRDLWSKGLNPIIGINTGCSPTLPHKKLSLDGHRRLIRRILAHPLLAASPVILLGGREDTDRNREIAEDLPVILSPTDLGLRDGLASVAACDLIFSGDSLGMHMAIGLKKWVVAWFGPSCEQEIELYGRGRKILTQAACSPCWKRDCSESKMCYDQVDFDRVTQALGEGLQWLTSSSKPHSPETSSSLSPF